MLLTTNRASSIDVAFQSRIHLTITYPKLDFPQRKQIWQTFTDPREASEKHYTEDPISEAQLNELAKMDLNGREIKSIARSARLLAARDEKALGWEHVRDVVDVRVAETAGTAQMVAFVAPLLLMLIVLAWRLYVVVVL